MNEIIRAHMEEIETLCREYGVVKLEVFGSVVTPDWNEETSDIDFIAEFRDTGPGYAGRYFHFSESLEGVMGRSVDVLTPGALKSPWFIEEISRTRQVIYAEHRQEAIA